jgi:hypothetical protein
MSLLLCVSGYYGDRMSVGTLSRHRYVRSTRCWYSSGYHVTVRLQGAFQMRPNLALQFGRHNVRADRRRGATLAVGHTTPTFRQQDGWTQLPLRTNSHFTRLFLI